MNYSDICKAFYISEEESKKNVVEFGLASVTSQGGIAEKIVTLGWSDEETEGILPDNFSTYNKWFYGSTGQKAAVWKRFQKDYKEEQYVKLLEDEFNDEVLPKVIKKLNISIPRGKHINKHMLAVAIARQMCEFSKSKKQKNETDSVLEEVYFASGTLHEALETTKIHSVAGKLDGKTSLMSRRPFRSPHHTISDVALVGGGAFPQPGEISLAHNGVLFLDELPEFKRTVLEVMRQPLEDRRISISRAKFSVEYPASFMLVASMNPCPCGYYNHPERGCVCAPGMVQRYLSRISGPLRSEERRVGKEC